MANAEVQSAKQAGRDENHQGNPDAPPAQLHTGGYDELRGGAPLHDKRRRRGQQEQQKERQLRFQKEQNREIEPNSMRVSMAEDESRPTARAQSKCGQTAQVEPWWHK